MARIKSGILGPVSGAIGPVVGAIDGGENTLRTKPKESAGTADNKSLPQNIKIPMMRKFLKKINAGIELGYHNVKTNLTAQNQAMSINVTQAIVGKHPNFSIDYSKVLISKGSREPGWGGTLQITDKRRITAGWEIPQTAKLKVIGDDWANILCYHESAGKAWFKSITTRKMLSAACKLPSSYTAGTVHVWLFFVSPDGKKTSRCDYLGNVVLV